MSTETSKKGDIGVAIVTADLINRGWDVLVPTSSSAPYDIVIHKEGQPFYKVQVKYRKIKNRIIHITFRRTILHNGKTTNRPYKTEEVDLFAIYCPDTNKCYYIDRKIMKGTSITLRMEPAKNNNTSKANLPEKFEKVPF